MKILVDTDVLVDLALDRRPHGAPAGELLDLLEEKRGIGFIAWHSASNDFEDAMQVAAALACGAEVIATRNVRDYAGAPVRAATPASLVKLLA